jgi:hypothetical protein
MVDHEATGNGHVHVITRDGALGDAMRAPYDRVIFTVGVGQDGERTTPIDKDGQVSLHWDADQPIDPAAIREVLNQPKTSAWSGATVGAGEPFDGVWLRMTGTEPDTCRIAAKPAAVESGLCTPAVRPAFGRAGSRQT